MASSINLLSVSPHCPQCSRTQTLAPSPSKYQFFSSKPFSFLPNIRTQRLRIRKCRSSPVVCASQSNFLKVKGGEGKNTKATSITISTVSIIAIYVIVGLLFMGWIINISANPYESV